MKLIFKLFMITYQTLLKNQIIVEEKVAELGFFKRSYNLGYIMSVHTSRQYYNAYYIT